MPTIHAAFQARKAYMVMICGTMHCCMSFPEADVLRKVAQLWHGGKVIGQRSAAYALPHQVACPAGRQDSL